MYISDMTDLPLTCKISPEKIWTSSKRYLLLTVLAYTIVLLLFYALNAWVGATDLKGFWTSFGTAFALLVLYTLMRWRNRRLSWESYLLTWEKQTITCKRIHYPDIVLYHNDIKSVQTSPKGDLIVRGSDPGDSFIIPRGLDRYDQLKEWLEGIAPFQQPVGRSWRTIGKVLAVAAYGSLFITLICLHDRRTFLGGASFSIVMQVLNLLYALRSKDLSNNGKITRIITAVVGIPVLIMLMFMP